MKQNKSHIVIIVLFIAMITLPQIVFWMTKDETSDVSSTENRKLNEKPELEFTTITEYPKNFDDYYNDHLPFRTELRNLYASLNYNIFNTTIDNNVIIGKNGWLFYRGNNTIEQLQGTMEYTTKEKNYILTNLQMNFDRLKEKNIEMYVLVLPNKENVYREYLPSSIQIKKEISMTEELIKYVKDNSNINIIYPKEELLKAKEKYQVYRKYDTHWNKIGSFIGTIALQKAIEPNFSYDINSIEIKRIEETDFRDLANFASLDEKISENIVKVDNFYPEIKFTLNKNDQYEEYVSNSENDKKILFIGDSFREDMKEYFSKLYKRVIYLHTDKYTESLIYEIKPDIVIIESVERYSKQIGKKLFK